MDKFDRERFAAAYRLIAEVLERERPEDTDEDHLSFILGNLTRRVFVGSQFDPPDELLEAAAQIIRSSNNADRKKMSKRLREHATHLDQLDNKS